MNKLRHILTAGLILLACVATGQILPDVPEGAQIVTLRGIPRYAPAPSDAVTERLATARSEYEADPENADAIIWYGRRTAYAGDYRGAIEIYSKGIERFPDDARMYRHRGHRYITIREFERAIADLEKAAGLIEGTENETEADGLPNALNIPVSSLHGNVWYHLGLAYYLVQDWDNAYRAYKNGFDAGRNDDNRVSTAHWLYMIMQRKGDPEAAANVLNAISADMNVIENMSYHSLCLFYKGELSLEELLGDNDDSPAAAAIVYGIGNWYHYNGETDRGDSILRSLLESPSWSSFGYIAAEADLAAR